MNLWYLDDGSLSDDYRAVLKDLEMFLEAVQLLGLKLKPTKCNFNTFVTSLKNDER